MTKATPADDAVTQSNQTKANGQAPGRVITNPNEVAHLVMMQIDNVNSKKDELTIAVKTLADTAKQLVGVYANQQAQIAKLAKKVEELEKANIK
jgi:ABC-type transporter Mla subunit MlaD